jgi:hypothetical protein
VLAFPCPFRGLKGAFHKQGFPAGAGEERLP